MQIALNGRAADADASKRLGPVMGRHFAGLGVRVSSGLRDVGTPKLSPLPKVTA